MDLTGAPSFIFMSPLFHYIKSSPESKACTITPSVFRVFDLFLSELLSLLGLFKSEVFPCGISWPQPQDGEWPAQSSA